MLKKNIVIVSTILLASLTVSASAQTIAPIIIGGDKDARGCLIGAGYSWNEAKKACTRSWEEQKDVKEVQKAVDGSDKSARLVGENNDKRLEKARKEVDKVMARLDAAITRIKILANRTSSRIDKVSLLGVDVTASRKFLSDARLRLDEARTKSALVRATADSALNVSQVPKSPEVMKNLQALVKDATTTIQWSQRLVAQSIAALKPGLNKEQPATTSIKVNR